MRKKILLTTVFIIFVASIFAIWFIKNNDLADNNTEPSTEASSTAPSVEVEDTEICWNMNGVFINDGGSEEAITVTIDGKIIEDENGYYKLDANVDLPKGFRYMLGDTNVVSMNQKYNDLPNLMLFNGYTYHAPTNSSTFTYFGLDLENESLIILFENAPRCYLVASQNTNMDSQQLLAHFKDFIDKEATLAWGFHERFYFTNCRITPTFNLTDYGNALYLPDYYRDRLVSQIATAEINKNGIDCAKIDPYSVVKVSTQYSIDLLTGETISLMYVSVKNSYKPDLTHYLFIGSQAYECITDLSEVFDELDAYLRTQKDTFVDLSCQQKIDTGALPERCRLRGLHLYSAQIINANAFSDRRHLEQVRLGDSLREVYTGAFRNCPNLKEVYFQRDPKVLEPGIFDSGVTLYAPAGGTVEAYAKAEGLTFLPLPETIPPLSASPADPSASPDEFPIEYIVPDTYPEINTFDSGIQVPTLPIPADNASKEEWISFFYGMLRHYGSWYNMALTSYYTSPKEMDLGLFFCNGTTQDNLPLTSQEYKFGVSNGLWQLTDFSRMPASDINSILDIYFGTDLSIYDMSEYDQFHYFEETDCYYLWGTGFHGAEVLGIVDFEKSDNGIYSVRYIQSSFTSAGDVPAEVVFRRVGDYFQILSNRPLP